MMSAAAIDTMQRNQKYKIETKLPLEQLETQIIEIPLDLHKSDFEFLTPGCDTLMSQKLHSLGISDNPHFEVSIETFWPKRTLPKLVFVSLQLTRSTCEQVPPMSVSHYVAFEEPSKHICSLKVLVSGQALEKMQL